MLLFKLVYFFSVAGPEQWARCLLRGCLTTNLPSERLNLELKRYAKPNHRIDHLYVDLKKQEFDFDQKTRHVELGLRNIKLSAAQEHCRNHHPNADQLGNYVVVANAVGTFTVTKRPPFAVGHYTVEPNPFVVCDPEKCLVRCPYCGPSTPCAHALRCNCQKYSYGNFCHHTHIVILQHFCPDNMAPCDVNLVNAINNAESVMTCDEDSGVNELCEPSANLEDHQQDEVLGQHQVDQEEAEVSHIEDHQQDGVLGQHQADQEAPEGTNIEDHEQDEVFVENQDDQEELVPCQDEHTIDLPFEVENNAGENIVDRRPLTVVAHIEDHQQDEVFGQPQDDQQDPEGTNIRDHEQDELLDQHQDDQEELVQDENTINWPCTVENIVDPPPLTVVENASNVHHDHGILSDLKALCKRKRERLLELIPSVRRRVERSDETQEGINWMDHLERGLKSWMSSTTHFSPLATRKRTHTNVERRSFPQKNNRRRFPKKPQNAPNDYHMQEAAKDAFKSDATNDIWPILFSANDNVLSNYMKTFNQKTQANMKELVDEARQWWLCHTCKAFTEESIQSGYISCAHCLNFHHQVCVGMQVKKN